MILIIQVLLIFHIHFGNDVYNEINLDYAKEIRLNVSEIQLARQYWGVKIDRIWLCKDNGDYIYDYEQVFTNGIIDRISSFIFSNDNLMVIHINNDHF